MKKNFLQCENTQNLSLLIARLAIGSIFILAGWGKFQNLEMVTGMLQGLSFPLPTLFAYLLATVELVGGIAIILGIFTKIAALLLAFTMLVAILTAHLGDFQGARLAIALLGANMALFVTGGGAWKTWSKKCPLS